MPSMFSVPLPENLDEELALEDQRLQRKRGRALAAASAGGGGSGSTINGSSGSANGQERSNTSSFAVNGVTPTGPNGNGSMSSAGGEGSPTVEETDIFSNILLLSAESTGGHLFHASSASPPGVASSPRRDSARGVGAGSPGPSNGALDAPGSPGGSGTPITKNLAASPNTSGMTSPMASSTGVAAPSAFEQMLNTKPGPVPGMGRMRMRDVTAFCNFLYPGKKQSFSIKVSDQAKGLDVVDAAIKAFLAADERLRGKMSDNPRDYRLHIADDHTGEQEFQVSLDGQPGKCSSVALEATPVAYLNQFPQHKTLLPHFSDDIPFIVDVKGAKNSRTVLLAPDLTMDRVEEVLTEKMRLTDVVKGSLSAKFGPTAVGLNQSYGFGAGGEKVEAPLMRTRTLMSLHRFGVTQLGIQGLLLDDCPTTSNALMDDSCDSLNNFRKIDEEEASTYRQFEVVKTNKFGAKQDRILGVDRDRIYNTKSGNQLGKTKNPERNIADIHSIKTFADRPCYFEILYLGSGQDTDRIECKTKLDCAVLTETLRVLKKIAERKKDETKKEKGGFLSKLFGK